MNIQQHSLARYLHLLEANLKRSSLETPRPVADMGLTASQRERLGKAFKLDTVRFRSAAVLIPIQVAGDAVSIVLTHRSEDLRHHAGQISFPGGSLETGDTDLAQTALREAYEEIGLKPSHVRIVGYLPDYLTISGFRVTPVVGIVAAEASVTPDQREVTAIYRLPLAQLLDGSGIQQKTVEHDNYHYPVKELLFEGIRVWGATAAMLCMLRDELLQAQEALA